MKKENILFPLVDSSYDNKEILRAISILLSGQLTMGSLKRIIGLKNKSTILVL